MEDVLNNMDISGGTLPETLEEPKPKTKINNSKNIGIREVTDAEITRELNLMSAVFKGEQLVDVLMPKVVANYLGDPYVGSYNGVVYTVQADKKRKLPKSIAEHFNNIMINAGK